VSVSFQKTGPKREFPAKLECFTKKKNIFTVISIKQSTLAGKQDGRPFKNWTKMCPKIKWFWYPNVQFLDVHCTVKFKILDIQIPDTFDNQMIQFHNYEWLKHSKARPVVLKWYQQFKNLTKLFKNHPI
jgi:hypothetical protein